MLNKQDKYIVKKIHLYASFFYIFMYIKFKLRLNTKLIKIINYIIMSL